MQTASAVETAIAVRTAMALVFFHAAWGKVRHREAFAGVLANYRILPEFLIAPSSFALPVVEFVLGAAMLAGLYAPAPEYLAALLLAVFAAAMAVNLARGRRHIDCGCFQSALKQRLRWALVSRNALLVALLLMAAAIRARPAGLWPLIDASLAGIALFVVGQSANVLWSGGPASMRKIHARAHER